MNTPLEPLTTLISSHNGHQPDPQGLLVVQHHLLGYLCPPRLCNIIIIF